MCSLLYPCVCVSCFCAATRVAFAAEAVSVYEGESAVVKLAANGLLTGDIAVYLISSGAVCESCTHYLLDRSHVVCSIIYCAYWHV